MDNDLVKEIRATVTAHGLSLNECGEEDARCVENGISDRFVDDSDCVWWWESLKEKSPIIHYGDKLGWDFLPNLLGDMSLEVYFLPTDDEPNPWPVFSGTCDEVVVLLREMWRFEYMIAAQNLEWVIFDTHHNSLVVTGSLSVGGMEHLL